MVARRAHLAENRKAGSRRGTGLGSFNQAIERLLIFSEETLDEDG